MIPVEGEDRLIIGFNIFETCTKETFPLSAQLGGKAKQRCACKGLYEISLTGVEDGQGLNRFTKLSTPLTACNPA
jgi:hypothetical protein